MSSAAHDESYGDPRWWHRHRGPWGCWGWGSQSWGWSHNGGAASVAPPWAHPFWAPLLIPRPVLIVLMILGFIFWWPIGLVLLAVMIWRKQMFCGGYRRYAPQGGAPWSDTGWKSWRSGGRQPPSSGNRAFDEYRTETLRRLEEEQKEFAEFLERLRFAKDKAEFDQFMNERRNPPQTPPEPAPQS